MCKSNNQTYQTNVSSSFFVFNKGTSKLYFFTLLIISISSFLQAQNRQVSGTVKDAISSEPLPGAYILIKGTDIGTVTDIDGHFVISASPSDTVVVTFIGYSDNEFIPGNQTTFSIALKEDLKQLEEVVVIGYGTVRKSDLTGSISSIKSDELVKVPSSNAMQALQGKVTGVQITSTSGAPGASPVVRIRGVGTYGNAAPIYVVDGVITDNIDFLSSSDIESMEILKDASATAIYGNRGANGVIIITTKLGNSESKKPVVQVTAEYSMQALTNRIDLLNGKEYAKVANEISPGSYNNVDLVPNTNWQDLIYELAPLQNYQTSLAGGNKNNQYYLGISYFDQSGIIPKSSYQRVSLKLNNKYKINDVLSLGNNFTISPFLQKNTKNDAPFNVYRAWPTIEPYNDDGSYAEVPGVGNILADLEYTTDNKTRGIRTLGNIFAELTFWESFHFKTSFQVDAYIEQNQVFTPEFFVSAAQQNENTRLNRNSFNSATWIWENLLNYKKEIGDHRIDAFIGFSMQDVTSRRTNLEAFDLLREDKSFWYINQDNINPNNITDEVDPNNYYSMISYMGRINYTFSDRYLFTATFRRDGSSKFIGDNRYHNFPSFAAGWNISNESFYPQGFLISTLKLRSSWGILGNEKVDYNQIYSRVDNGINAVFGQTEYLANGSTYGASGNPILIWEESKQLDIGVEVGILDDKLTGEFDYYNRSTTGILVDLTVPGYLGNGTNKIFYNAAEIQNKGFEFKLSWQETRGDFGYQVDLLGTTIDNNVNKISESGGSDNYLLGTTNNYTVSRTEAGLPIGAFYGYNVIGIFQTADELANYPSLFGAQVGDLKFEDVNGDGVLNGDDRTFLGSPIPEFVYGINLNASYKQFTIGIDFQGQTGNKIYNIKEAIRPSLYNFEAHVANFWTPQNNSTTEPRPTSGGNNWLPSSRFIQDGGFFRLRTVTVGYTIPDKISSKAKMNKAYVFVRGTNILTLTKFTGYTPEVASSNELINNVDLGTFPVPSVYSLGLNLTF